jgi:hypothetical protein
LPPFYFRRIKMITIKLNRSLGFDETDKEIIETKTYIAPQPKARMVRNASEMAENLDEKKLKTADLDSMIDFVVELFGKKFTADDIWDGIDADKLIPIIIGCINGVMDGMNSKLSTIPNGQAE